MKVGKHCFFNGQSALARNLNRIVRKKTEYITSAYKCHIIEGDFFIYFLSSAVEWQWFHPFFLCKILGYSTQFLCSYTFSMASSGASSQCKYLLYRLQLEPVRPATLFFHFRKRRRLFHGEFSVKTCKKTFFLSILLLLVRYCQLIPWLFS